MNHSNEINYILHKLARYLLIAGLIVLAYFMRGSIVTALIPLILAFVFYLILSPLMNLFTKKLKLNKVVATILALIILIAIIAAGIIYIVPIVVNGIQSSVDSLPQIVEGLKERLGQIETVLNDVGIPMNISEQLNKIPALIEDSVSVIFAFLANTLAVVSTFLVSLYFTFFFLHDRKILINGVFRLVPLKRRDRFRTTVKSINSKIKLFLKTQLLIAVISLVGTMAGYFIIGLNYALPLGVIMGICCLVPYIGPIVGAAPAILIALLQTDKLLYTVIAILIIQLGLGALSPKIMGQGLGIHPVYILLGLLFFTSLMGFIGMFLAIPLLIIISEILNATARRHKSYIGN